MNRRQFTKLLGMAGMGALAPWSLPARAAAPYNGPFYISLAAIGGWDVASFCDPKLNIGGERTINTWASGEGIAMAGNIAFAPVANNQSFFERFYQDMLVINGIDAQTNSHDDGVRHNWSGRLSQGYPSFGAIASAATDPVLPLSLVHARGYSETANITRYSRLNSPDVIRNLIEDNSIFGNNFEYGLVEDNELAMIEQAQQARLQRQMANTSKLPRQSKNLNNLYLANSTRDDLKAFSDLLPEEFHPDNDFRAAELALLAYQSGLCVSCQLGFSGFDTHQNHDALHFDELAKLTDLAEFIFDRAEEMGIADRIVMFMSSDFGRRPFYNAGGGKDHHPIGSAIIIKQGASWGNRVVGATDDTLNALQIHPQSLQPSSGSGAVQLEPKHVQQAMRQLGGFDQSPIAQAFPLNAEDVNFFDSSASTV